MRLVNIPFQCFFRKVEDDIITGPVFLKPNIQSIVISHVLCHDPNGKTVYLPNDLEVEILDKISNF